MQSQLTFKFIVVGNCGVGKTCMVTHFTQSAPIPWTYVPTKEKNVTEHKLQIENTNVSLQIWDLSGDEMVITYTSACYFNSHAAIVAYSMNDKSSFHNVQHWMENIERTLSSNVYNDLPKAIVGLKQDRKPIVDKTTAQQVASSFDCRHYTGSCKFDGSFDQVFLDLTKSLLDKRKKQLQSYIPTNISPTLQSATDSNSSSDYPTTSERAITSQDHKIYDQQSKSQAHKETNSKLISNERAPLMGKSDNEASTHPKKVKPTDICDCGCNLM